MCNDNMSSGNNKLLKSDNNCMSRACEEVLKQYFKLPVQVIRDMLEPLAKDVQKYCSVELTQQITEQLELLTFRNDTTDNGTDKDHGIDLLGSWDH